MSGGRDLRWEEGRERTTECEKWWLYGSQGAEGIHQTTVLT